MDHIDKHLATAASDKKYLLSIQAALAIGKHLLNKYYSSTDKSELYRIAMSTYNLYDFSFIANLQRFSSPSEPQTRIFRTGRLGCRMAHNRRRNPSNRVQMCICRHPGGRQHCPCHTSVYYSLFFCFFDWSLLQDERDPIFNNIFNALPTVSHSKKVGLADEITQYLSAPTEATLNPLV